MDGDLSRLDGQRSGRTFVSACICPARWTARTPWRHGDSLPQGTPHLSAKGMVTIKSGQDPLYRQFHVEAQHVRKGVPLFGFSLNESDCTGEGASWRHSLEQARQSLADPNGIPWSAARLQPGTAEADRPPSNNRFMKWPEDSSEHSVRAIYPK
jgi:hypothetical protein